MNAPTIDGIILINEFNDYLMKLGMMNPNCNKEELITELYRIFPIIVKKAEIRTELKKL